MRYLIRLRWPFLIRIIPPVVILIRHAEVDYSANSDPILGPPLTSAGSARPQALRHVLGDTGIDAIYVTEKQRTKLTAAPLAADLGINPIQIDIASDVVAAIRNHPSSSTVLVVGHTDTIPQIIATLGGPSGVVIDGGEFDRLFVLSGRLTRMRYGA